MNLTPESFAPFGDPEAFLVFLGVNEMAHQTIGSTLARAGYIVSAVPPLGNPLDDPSWLLDHWQRHMDECSLLGVPVPDLSAVDLTDEAQYYDWMLLHGNLHSEVNAALGITS